MQLLEERIAAEGGVCGSDVVKVDMFLNHQIDPFLMQEMGKEFKRLFANEGVTKVLTVESSGIAIAAFAALELGVPFVFAKKYNARNLDENVYQSEVFSFTKQKSFMIRVSKRYITENDTVLIIDDFLANGCALKGLIDIVSQAGARVAGCGIAIEKSFQPGADMIKKMGYRVESLARIKSICDGKIEFC